MNKTTGKENATMIVPQQHAYYAVFVVTSYESFDDALARSPDAIAAHVARSQELHANGTLLMGGAFLNNSQEPLSTMAVLTSREAAEEYMRGDPFVLKGMVSKWYIREWANMFA
ncbi:MAG: YciI family protein [Ktedonobacteraceae bacterium]